MMGSFKFKCLIKLLPGLGLAVLLIVCGGCAYIMDSNSMHRYSLFMPDMSHLKKKVWLAGLDNQTFYKGHKKIEALVPDMAKYLKSTCSRLAIVFPGDDGFAEKDIKLDRMPDQTLDNFSLARIGRRFGLNAVALLTLNDIEPDKENLSVFGIHTAFFTADLLFTVQIWDTETAAKLIETYIELKIDLTEAEYKQIMQKENVDIESLDERIRELVTESGDIICDVVEDQDWKGFVTTIAENRVMISSGQTSRIKEGDIFDVMSIGPLMNGPANTKFQTPGVKIGEIKIIRVLSDQAEAEIISGEGITVGCTVKPTI